MRVSSSCDFCNRVPVDMSPKQICHRHSHVYFNCIWIVGEGNIFQREGNLQMALDRYLYVLEVLPTYTMPMLQVILLFQKNGYFAESLKYVNRWLEISPTDDTALNCKGVALCGLGRYPEAIECFEQSKHLYDPYRELAVGFHAYALYKVGCYNDALNFCDGVSKNYLYYKDVKKIKKDCRKQLGLSTWRMMVEKILLSLPY